MSLPNIPNITPIIDLDREKVVNMLMASIALEEMGLAHIINAEGEKIQYVLDSEKLKPASIGEIKEFNQSVERVVREAMKMQMLLQEKLENIISLIPKTPDPPCPQPPCPHPPGPKCKPACALTGCGEGCVSNKSDPFYGEVASVESSICPVYENIITFSIKYICKERCDNIISAIFLAIPESIEVHCPNKLNSSPVIQDPNLITLRGQGVMAIKDTEQKLAQCTVAFTLTVWDHDCNKKFQMVTRSPNDGFNHDSGVVSVTSGDLEIKRVL